MYISQNRNITEESGCILNKLPRKQNLDYGKNTSHRNIMT